MNVADRQKPQPGELFLDHVSHFVPDLEAAASALEALGLKVTPTSVQMAAEGPIGASNRCVMLEEGYIELLSPTHRTPAAQRMRTLMARYDGVHLACFGAPDAEDEQRRLAANGFESGLAEFERAVAGGTARFKAVRVPPETMPEGRIQYVQHVTPEHVWLQGYVNPFRLEEVYVVAEDPAQAAARWARFAALIPAAEGDLVRLGTTRGSIVIGNRPAIAKILGDAPPPPAIAGYSLSCADPQRFASHCARGGLKVDGLVVRLPPAVGGSWRLRIRGLP